MKRTKSSLRIPDIINKSTNKNFTQIPNDVFHNENLSYKAVGLLGMLLSNKEGWCSYIKTLVNRHTDGIASVKSGLQELEKEGYLVRIKYRDKKKKRIRGSFWIYTDIPRQFEGIEETDELLDKKGMIADWPEYLKVENLKVENLFLENQQIENHSLIILNNKKTKSNNTNTPDSDESAETDNNKPSSKERTKKYIPLSKHLAKTVSSHINYKIDSKRIQSWANDIRLLHEKNKVPIKRIKEVLNWYRKNIGGQYIPEAYSGSAFREKFPKLEAAIKRQSNPPTNGQSKKSLGYRNPEGYQYKEVEEIV